MVAPSRASESSRKNQEKPESDIDWNVFLNNCAPPYLHDESIFLLCELSTGPRIAFVKIFAGESFIMQVPIKETRISQRSIVSGPAMKIITLNSERSTVRHTAKNECL